MTTPLIKADMANIENSVIKLLRKNQWEGGLQWTILKAVK